MSSQTSYLSQCIGSGRVMGVAPVPIITEVGFGWTLSWPIKSRQFGHFSALPSRPT